MKRSQHTISQSRLPRLFYKQNETPLKLQVVLDKLKPQNQVRLPDNKVLVALAPSVSMENPWLPRQQQRRDSKVLLQPIGKSREQSVRSTTACSGDRPGSQTVFSVTNADDLIARTDLLEGDAQIQSLIAQSRALRREWKESKAVLQELSKGAKTRLVQVREYKTAAEAMKEWSEEWGRQLEGLERLFAQCGWQIQE